MSDKKITKEKLISHPMEDVLGIEPGSTLIEYEETPPTELVKIREYDAKDNEIEDQLQNVYDRAMDAFDEQSGEAELVDGKFKARNAEVAAQFLNTALAAVNAKSGMKKHKDKLEVAKTNAAKPGTVNNNLIVDRNDILRALQGIKEDDETK